MTYGLIPYGLGPYGGVPTEIHLSRAYATSTNTVVVETTTPAFAGLGFEAGAALNPATWLLVRQDTGAEITVLGVRLLDPSTFELWTLETLGPWQVTHDVSTTTLLSATGLIITSPYDATFPGVVASYDPDPARSTEFRDRDLANPRPGARVSGVDGTLVIAGGDYASEAEPELTRKIVLRRLTTVRGSIRHRPTFGLKVAIERTIYGGATVAEITRDVLEQVRAEPTVTSAQARVLLNYAQGVVQIDAYFTIAAAPQATLTVGVSFDRQSGLVQAA